MKAFDTRGERDMSEKVEPMLLRERARPGIPAYHAFLPSSRDPQAAIPLVLCIHGVSRDAQEQVNILAHEAEVRGYALLAPHFDAKRWQDYQRLGRRGRGPRADLALRRARTQFETESGQSFGPIFLLGFSGGAQFAHRFAMTHPTEITAAVCASAGWYTLPEPGRRYPRGLRADAALTGVCLDPRRFLRVPILVAVGSADLGRDESFRLSARLDETQGRSRVERARRFHQAMRDAAQKRGLVARTEYVEFEGAGHSFSECVRHGLAGVAFDFFGRALEGIPS